MDFLNLKITNKCNSNCEFCYMKKEISNELQIEEINSIMYDFSNLGGKMLLLSGGEPLLHKDIYSIIKISNNYGLYSALATNSIIIDEHVLKKLFICGLNEIHFSLGDMENKENNKLIMEKILLTRKLKINLKIVVNIITSRNFINKIDDNLDWIYENLDIDLLECIPPKSGDNIKWYHKNEISINDFCILKEKLLQSNLNYIFDCGYFAKIKPVNLKQKMLIQNDCNAINKKLNSVSIFSNGDVFRCAYAKDNSFYMGNIRSNSLKDIIQGYKFNNNDENLIYDIQCNRL